jgi:hypothetical protein
MLSTKIVDGMEFLMAGKPLGERAMTATERQQKWRTKKRHERMRRELKAYRDPAAKRPTPKRAGLDFWPTPPDVAAVLVQHVLPAFGSQDLRIWECAAGDGRLGDAMAAGYDVVMTDANPQRSDIGRLDFLKDPLPDWAQGSVLATNPPFAGSGLGDSFIARALELVDSGFLQGAVLLQRGGADSTAGRADLFNRAAAEYRCNWRPRWIPGTTQGPRWWFGWFLWRAGEAGPPITLRITRKSLALSEQPPQARDPGT